MLLSLVCQGIGKGHGMGLAVSGGALQAAAQRLAVVLADLERLGEHVAAAHVTAALDAIEERLETGPLDGESSQPPRASLTIARQMRDIFGDEAEFVARRQLGAATGSALLAWAAIVNQIVR